MYALFILWRDKDERLHQEIVRIDLTITANSPVEHYTKIYGKLLLLFEEKVYYGGELISPKHHLTKDRPRIAIYNNGIDKVPNYILDSREVDEVDELGNRVAYIDPYYYEVYYLCQTDGLTSISTILSKDYYTSWGRIIREGAKLN